MSREKLKKGILLLTLLTLCVSCFGCGKTEPKVQEYVDVSTETIVEQMKTIVSEIETKDGTQIESTSEDGLMVVATYKNPTPSEEEPLFSEDLTVTYTGSSVLVGSLENNKEFEKITINEKDCYYQTSDDESTIMLFEDIGNETYMIINISKFNPDISVKEACEIVFI